MTPSDNSEMEISVWCDYLTDTNCPFADNFRFDEYIEFWQYERWLRFQHTHLWFEYPDCWNVGSSIVGSNVGGIESYVGERVGGQVVSNWDSVGG